MKTIIQKKYRKFLGCLLVVGVFVIPNLSLAVGVSSQCSLNGYTVATINGVFTDEKGAQGNMFALQDIFGLDWHGQSVDFQYLLNPSHLAGLGDLAMSAYQKVFDNETVKDYDLVEMLKDASAKVKTQKLLLVAHSQGNFYANSFYDTVAGKTGGVPSESIGVYAVATPAGRVAGGGKWVTSDTDKVIADWVSLVPFKKIMAPNTNIVLAEGDDSKGHNFSGVYLKHRGSEIVSAIQTSLNQLTENNIQNKDNPCLAPPKLTLAHKAEGAILSVVDPAANTSKDAVIVLAAGAHQAGKMLAKEVYSLTNLLAGAYASLLPEDNKPPEKVYSLWVGPEENNASGQNVGHSMSNINKIALAEESLQVLQNQLLALQNIPPSRTPLDGTGNSSSLISASAEPKSVAPVYSFFGGGGTGATSASSSSTASSASESSSSSVSSASSSSSYSSSSSISVESSSSSLPASSSSSTASSANESSFASSSNISSSSSASSASESSSSSAPDTTPPTISSFSLSQCQQSLSSDGCLIATTTVFLSWESPSSDLDYFELTSNGTISTTTATSTALTLADNSNNSFSLRAKDLAGNWSTASTQTAEISTMPVVINEVAWAGNSATYSADEWIELYNRTGKTINLNNFVLYSQADLTPYIPLSGTIASAGYFLLERTNDNTVSNIAANQIYAGSLKNNPSAEALRLVYSLNNSTTTIDYIPTCGSNWCGGSSNYYSMERHSPDIAGTVASNWGTNNTVIRNSQNAGGGSLNGTPKARNSLNYLVNKGQTVSSNLTLSASGSPYLVNNTLQTFNASSTLTIEPGVVIKFYNDAGWQFLNGAKILAQGTAANPIIFTSFYDDGYGGDTNGDGVSTSPSPGNWFGLRIDSPGAESSISRAIFRYGGKYYSGGSWSDSKANLYVANSPATITNSVFEYSKSYGARLSSASTTFSGNTFRYNNNSEEGDSTGLYSLGGTLTANSNTFSNNKRGLYVLGAGSASVDSNTFTSNTNEAIYSFGALGNFTNNSGSSNGVNAISLNGTITQNGATTTLSANSLPYLLNGNATVAASSTLAVNSGVALKGWSVGSTSYLNVYGNLIVSGTNFSDIVFGSMFSSPAKGSWGGVRFYSGSYSNISGATFEYADTAIAYTGSPLNLANVKFNENNLGVSADSASRAYPINVSGIIFTNNTATTSPGGLW